jgi:hypothetical protein
MRWRFKKDETSILDEPIAQVLTSMNQYGPDSPEYPALVKHLSQLIKLQSKEGRRRISPDTILHVVGNVVLVSIIVVYEQKHVLASKGLGFIIRPSCRNINRDVKARRV